MANRNDTNTRREGGTGGNGHGYHDERAATEGTSGTEAERARGETDTAAGSMRTTAGTAGEPRPLDTGGRFYTEAMGRGRDRDRDRERHRDDDHLLGMGYAASGRGGRDWTGGTGAPGGMGGTRGGFGTGEWRGTGSDYRGDMGRDYRGDYRRDLRETTHEGGRREPLVRVVDRRGEGTADRGYEGWTGGFTEGSGTGEYEHARRGFRDFGTPTYGQGRELRERHTDADFRDRDDRVAGRSGRSFHPEDMGPSHPWHPPEEDWERSHWRHEHERGRGMGAGMGGMRARGAHRDRGHWEHEATTAEDVMTQNPKSVRPEANLREVARIMRDENCGVVPVVGTDRRLLGLITDRDMVLRTADNDRAWSALTAREVMTDEIEAVTPDEPVREIIHLMARRQVRRVPVVDRQDRLLGLISMVDIANRAERDEDLQEAMVQVSRRKSFWRKLWT